MYTKPEIKSFNYYESFFNGFSIKVIQPNCPINKILIGTINAYTATTIIIKAHQYNIDDRPLYFEINDCKMSFD